MTLTILLLILIIVLVLSHEAGHFLLAKWRGVRVDEFGIGFPPRLLSIKKGETRYSLNLFPLGGFVKIFGENGDDPSTQLGANGEGDPRSFVSKSLGTRSLIVAGGVLANIVIAWIIFFLLAGIGTPQVVEDGLALRSLGEAVEITIAAVADGSPAHVVGLKPGDRLRGFDSIPAAQAFIEDRKGVEISLEIIRGREPLTIRAVPRVRPPEGEGALGIAMVEIAHVAVPWWQAPWKGLRMTVEVFLGTITALARMAWGVIAGVPGVAEEVTGPVGIASLVSEVSQFGLLPFFQLMAVLSVNLAVINFLPIPALDGGRLLFFAIEAVRRKPISARVSHWVHTVGFAFLIALMLVITYRDIVRLL